MAVCGSLQSAVYRRQLTGPPNTALSRETIAVAAAPRALEQVIGYAFRSQSLLTEALTHPSATSSGHRRARRTKPAQRGYERLEFLGDRVLGLVIAELLWRRFGEESEGLLTRRQTHLVRREALAQVAKAIGLGDYLILSRAERAAGAAANPAILADACEAIIAAIYLEGGLEAARAFVHRFWEPLIAAMEGPPRDPKTALQEWAQARVLGLPQYELLASSGPHHAPLFTVAARIAGEETATATASTKRTAEASAAAALLGRIAPKTQKTG